MKRVVSFLIILIGLLLTSCSNVEESAKSYEGYKTITLDGSSFIRYKSDQDMNFTSELSPLEKFLSSYDKVVEDGLDFNLVLDDINNSKLDYIGKAKEYYKHDADYYYGSNEYRECTKDLLSKDEVRMLSRVKQDKQVISSSSALEDLEYLDRFFRSFYGAYKLHGKEKFKSAYESSISDIKKHDRLTYYDLKEVFDKNYAFIQDGHLKYGNDYDNFNGFYENSTDGYILEDLYFLLDDKGYYLKDYSPRIYLTKVNGVDDFKLSYTIDLEGKLCYAVTTTLTLAQAKAPYYIELDDNKFEVELSKMNGLADFNYWNNEFMESFTLSNGYPVVALRSFWEDLDYKRYMNLGKILNKEKVVIHDTRSNGGGDIRYADGFLNSLLGTKFDNGYLMNGDIGYTDYYKFVGNENNHLVYGDNGFLKIFYPRPSLYSKNDKLFILLSDGLSASSGDAIVDYARGINNALVIGEPTAKIVSSGNTVDIYLPNSGFHFVIGTNYSIWDVKGNDLDGYGIEPDIWVKSADALAKTTLMLEHYNVSKSDSSKELVEEYGYGENNFIREANDTKKEEYRLSERMINKALSDEEGICFNFVLENKIISHGNIDLVSDINQVILGKEYVIKENGKWYFKIPSGMTDVNLKIKYNDKEYEFLYCNDNIK